MKLGGIGIRTKIIIGDAATWYLVKKYVDGKVAQPRHIIVDEDGNEMQDLPKLKFVGADVENVDGATVVTFTKEQPEFIQIINKINLSWVDGFVYINTGSVLNPWSGTTSKKVIVHSLSINIGQGTTILNPIINYPSAATYQVSSIPTGFYIKDTDNLLQINNDFEHLEIQYSIVDDTVRKYDSTKFNYGSNVIIDDSSLPHADAMYAIFYDIYPAFDKSLIKTCTDTLANNTTIDPFFTPTFCKERDSNLIFRPQLDAARYKETGSNADILTVGSHYNNVFARVDITENSTTFLKNVIAIGSCPDVELPTMGTSYGYGLEFFEDNVKTSDVYPDYVYNVWSPIYQQSATSAIIAAKFRMIKDATKASWGLCRIAARATAKKTVGGIYDSGYAWDMYRGFGIIDVNDAIDYIEEIYKSDEYIQMLADQHEGLNKVNEFITYDKLLANSPVPKRHLDAALDLKVDKLANHSLVPDTEIDKLAEYPELKDLEFSHDNLTGKNSEAAFQHVDTNVTKETLDEADKVPLYDSVTGNVVLTPKSNLQSIVQNTGTSETAVMSQKAVTNQLVLKEATANKQNSLATDGTGVKFPTVDAVNGGLASKQATLVSGMNIKTVNGKSLVGSGDLLPIGSLLADYTHTANKEVFISSYDINTNTFTSVAHGLSNGNIIAPTLNSNVENVYPLVVYLGGMASNKVYYVINKTDDTFQISLTSGGSVLDLTANVTADISKWHFEMGTAITISNIPASRSIKIVMYGKAQQIHGAIYMKPSTFDNTGYDGATNAIAIPLSNSDAGLFSEIYYTSGAISFMLSRLNTITNATASTYTENYSTKYVIRKKDYGYITQIISNGIFVIYFNGFNIKIYNV